MLTILLAPRILTKIKINPTFSWNNFLKKLPILTGLLFLLSCSSRPVIRRDYRGIRLSPKQLPEFEPLKKKAVLLTILNEGVYGGQDIAVTATEELRKELYRTGHFLIDQMASKNFGRSKDIYSGGGSKLYQLAKKARQQGINLIIFGRIMKTKIREKSGEIGIIRQTHSISNVLVELKVFDTTSHKVIFSNTVPGTITDKNYRFFLTNPNDRLYYRQDILRYTVRVAMRKFIPLLKDLATKLDWTGRVARIIGNKIYINAGRESGIQIGDILKVLTESTEIYDPETGALLGLSKGELKATIEIIDYFGPDAAMAIHHSGGVILEGDFVQLY